MFSLLLAFAGLPIEVVTELVKHLTLPWFLQFVSKAMYALVHDTKVRLCVPVKLGELWGGGVKLGHVNWLHNQLIKFEGRVSFTSLKLRMNVIGSGLIDPDETDYWPERHTPYLHEVLMLLIDRYRTEICAVEFIVGYSSYRFFKEIVEKRMTALTSLNMTMHSKADMYNEEVWRLFPKLEALRNLTWCGTVVGQCTGIYPRTILEFVSHVEILTVHYDFEGKSNEYGAIDAKFWTFICNRFADKVEEAVQEGALTRLQSLSILSNGRGLKLEALTRTITALALLTNLTRLELGHHHHRENWELHRSAEELRSARPDMKVVVTF
jgi:hypothetical protein